MSEDEVSQLKSIRKSLQGMMDDGFFPVLTGNLDSYFQGKNDAFNSAIMLIDFALNGMTFMGDADTRKDSVTDLAVCGQKSPTPITREAAIEKARDAMSALCTLQMHSEAAIDLGSRVMEKEDNCPVCGGELSQSEYDFQYHKEHWGPFGRTPNKKFPILGCPSMIANSRKG